MTDLLEVEIRNLALAKGESKKEGKRKVGEVAFEEAETRLCQ